ncbi:MAG TPA: DUF5915 domain-containing protein [Pseudonocardiaceae bacterium]|jgi:hypothetical protein|nr:DUF5915 domain-containing protein [Pseudonocardiaceae bacterium]
MTQNEPVKSPFTALPAKIDLGEMDRRIIQWWKASDVFARGLQKTADGPTWVFYEGPPTANGIPGTHHVEARVFKDIFPRYKTMKGYSVPRRAAGTAMAFPWSWRWRRSWGSAASRTSKRSAWDPRAVVDALRRSGTVQVTVDGDEITIGADDVLVTEMPRSGWVVESQRGVTIALDTEITPELVAEGTAHPPPRPPKNTRTLQS